jgi:hypothetical protein
VSVVIKKIKESTIKRMDLFDKWLEEEIKKLRSIENSLLSERGKITLQLFELCQKKFKQSIEQQSKVKKTTTRWE